MYTHFWWLIIFKRIQVDASFGTEKLIVSDEFVLSLIVLVSALIQLEYILGYLWHFALFLTSFAVWWVLQLLRLPVLRILLIFCLIAEFLILSVHFF